jgi:hypothetical protein
MSSTPVAHDYDWIAARAAEVGRSCGPCSLCCKLLRITKPASIAHERDVWCKHAEPGGRGCLIHSRRPMICRRWACRWLLGEVADIWNPDECKMVTSRLSNYPDPDSGQATIIFVDPDYIGAWRSEPWHGDLLRRLDLGERIYTVEHGVYQELLVQEPAPALPPESESP